MPPGTYTGPYVPDWPIQRPASQTASVAPLHVLNWAAGCSRTRLGPRCPSPAQPPRLVLLQPPSSSVPAPFRPGTFLRAAAQGGPVGVGTRTSGRWAELSDGRQNQPIEREIVSVRVQFHQ